MSFMTPPELTNLDALRNRGAKMIVVHGAADGVFSIDDTASWYDALDQRLRGKAGDAVSFFRVPGMGHSRGGPSTDQFDGFVGARRLGRKRQRARAHHCHGAWRRQCGRRQCRPAVRLVSDAHAPAVPLPEAGAIQGRRR
jgi:hypothetical protein